MIIGVVLILLYPGISCIGIGSDSNDKPPNVIVILADDQRADYLGCAGHPIVKTPNIDALAQRGMYFRNAFATSAACTPSRTSILTGQYERKHGVTFGSNSELTEEAFANTYPMLLKKAGYYTGYVGKNHTPIGKSEQGTGYKSGIMEKAFDYWYGNHRHALFYPKERHQIYYGAKSDTQVEIFEEGALNFLRENPEFAAANNFLSSRPDDKPFCLLINFNLPHGAGTNSMKLKPTDPELYRTAYRDQIDEMPQPKTYISKKDKTPKIPLHVYNGEFINGYNYVNNTETLRERQVRTCQTVTGIDNLVGGVVEKLRTLGIDKNTIIIYTSDHGLLHGEHGLGGKVLLYEESIRVPMIIYDPRAPKSEAGKQEDQLVLNIDIAPTILDLTGQPILKSMQGKSLKPLIYSQNPVWRNDIFCENMMMIQNYPRMESVRNENWKYIRYYSKENDQQHILSLIAPFMGEEPIYEELFNIKYDPNEMQNLAENPESQYILKELRQRCNTLLKEAKGNNSLPNTYVEEFKDSAFRRKVIDTYSELDFINNNR